MMPAQPAAARRGTRVLRQLVLRKPEPGPRQRGTRKLARQGMRQLHTRSPRCTISLPLATNARELFVQAMLERGRQHHHPVLAALALAHDDRAALEIDVLDPQTYAFHQPHAGAIQQLREQAMPGRNAPHQAADLFLSQHHRQPRLVLRAAQLPHPRQVEPKHLLVEKQQRRQRLLVRGRRHAALGSEPGQERLELRLCQLRRMTQAVEPDESTRPMDVRLLGANAVVHVPDLLAKGVEQALRRKL